ncbi:MAG: hypothetical protein KA715_04715 [Xanthomonadaceae bacterium]|nr:hypothetical protein [Xanthomonadaceae bacterium]
MRWIFILLTLSVQSSFAQTPSPSSTPLPLATPTPGSPSDKKFEQYNAFGEGSGENQALLTLHGVLSRLQSKDAAPVTLIIWDSNTVNVVEKAAPDDKFVFEAELKGHLSDPKKSLIVNFRRVKTEPDGSFTYKVKVDKAVTEIQINVILEDGSLQADPYALTVNDWNLTQGRENIRKKEDPRKFFFSPGLALTTITYSQTNTDVGTLNPIMVTLKIGADYRIQKKNWVIGLVGFMNVLPISGVTATTDFKFLGLNLRAGKKLDWLKTPWELTFSGGLYYLTMSTSGNFGFSNVAGPQFYPTVRYSLNNGGSFLSYFKFSPISQGFTLMSFTNFEIALGIHYQFPRTKKLGYSVGLDLSKVSLTTVDQNSVSGTANSQTISVGGTVSF